MIEVKTEFRASPGRLKKPVSKGVFTSLQHTAASISKDAKSSIKRGRRKKPSRAGRPPHTHRGAFLRRAIRFDVDKQKQNAVVGFMHSIVGEVGALHEFGEIRDGARYPIRPTLGPALDRAVPRMANNWRGSITA